MTGWRSTTTLPALLALLASSVLFGGIVRETPEERAARDAREAWERHLSKEHLHGVDLPTLEKWAKLANAACAPAGSTTRALLVGIGKYADPVVPDLNTDHDLEYVQAALKARGVTDQRILRDEQATFEAIAAELTDLLAASSCGDRIVVTWSGTGFTTDRRLDPDEVPLPGPVSITLAHDTSGCFGRESLDCKNFFSSHDLVDFVTSARNRGVEIVLLVDACHGTNLAEAGREQVWELPSTETQLFRLHADAAEFAAFFAAAPDSLAFETASPNGERMGAFTLAVTTALQDPSVATPRELGPHVLATLAETVEDGHQVPMIQASDPDMALFGGSHGSGTRGLEADLEITAPDASRGTIVSNDTGLVVAGRLRPVKGLIGVSVGGKPAKLEPDGSFKARVDLDEGENLVMVNGWFDDRSFKTQSFTVVRREDASAALREGGLYALLIGVQDYEDPGIRDLATPLADIDALSRVLGEYGFKTSLPGDASPDALVLRNPGRREILGALNRLVREVGEQDRVIVYYAGHSAVPPLLKQAHWLPSDALEGDSTDWIPADRIRQLIKQMAAKSVLVVSDSCYSAALTSRDVGVSQPPETRERAKFLLRMATQRSRILIASGNLEPVADRGGSGHSVFARVLLEQLENPERRGFTSTELFAPIAEKVTGNSSQSPQRSVFRDSGHNGGDFVFFRAGK